MKTQIKLLTAALALAAASAHAGVVYNVNNDASTRNETILIGNNASGTGTVIGANAKAIDTNVNHIGRATAIGLRAHANGFGVISLGADSHVEKDNGLAVGHHALVKGDMGTAIGVVASVMENTNESTALGARASVVESDVKDGQSKFTNEIISKNTGVVSVGQSQNANTALRQTGATYTSTHSYYEKGSFNRRIINVAGGMEDNDAVNVKQLTHVHDTLDGKISGLDTRVGAAEGTINTHTTQITGLTSRVDDAETNIGRLDTRVTALEAGGAAGSARVNQRLDNLENRVDTVERRANDGVALAIATASMAPPVYGKNHTVSVGTGFYRGSNALAIGYVYTNNNNWSLKTTVSGAGRGNFGGGVGTSFSW